MRFVHPGVLGRLALIYANNGEPDKAVQVLICIHRLFNTQYRDVYVIWRNLADQSKPIYGDIVNRIPVPDNVADLDVDDSD